MPETVHHGRSNRSEEPIGADEPCDESPDPEELLSILSDAHARAILESVSSESLPAREIVDRVAPSRPTVYRRLDRLERSGLVTTSMTYDPDGHHRKRYRATLDEVVLSLDSGRFVVDRSG